MRVISWTRALLAGVAVAGMAAGMAMAQTAPLSLSGSSNAAVAQAEKELLQADRDFNDEVQKSGLEAWVKWFAPRAVMFQGDTNPPAVGSEEIRKAMTDEFALPGYKLTWQPEGARALDSGKNGLTWGRWQRQFQGRDGKLRTMTGQYITVWRKQKDGTWRAVWDGGEGTPPPAKPQS
jgi:ketosteroid isomerase-like protein